MKYEPGALTKEILRHHQIAKYKIIFDFPIFANLYLLGISIRVSFEWKSGFSENNGTLLLWY